MALIAGDSTGLNVRVRLWLKARGFAETAIDRRSGDDVPRVPSIHDGKPQMWTIEYTQWIDSKWTEWATSLGFKRQDGEPAHRLALGNGHTDAEFDAWLIAQQGP